MKSEIVTVLERLPLISTAVLGVLLGSCAGFDQPNAQVNAMSALEREALWLDQETSRPNIPAAPTEQTVTVQLGDQLTEIARRITGSADNWQAIATENGIDQPTRLRVGQVLRVPAGLSAVSQEDAGSTGGLDLLRSLQAAQLDDPNFRLVRTDYDLALHLWLAVPQDLSVGWQKFKDRRYSLSFLDDRRPSSNT